MKRWFSVLILVLAALSVSSGAIAKLDNKIKSTKGKDWKLSVNYPVFKNKIMEDCNKDIKAAADSFYAEWESFYKKDYVRMEPDEAGGTELTYEVFYADTDAVSLLFLAESYTGGMHTIQEIFSINFDNVTKKRATAEDLGISYVLEELADYCERDAKRQFKVSGICNDSTELNELEPKIFTFSTVNATREALYFTFLKSDFNKFLPGRVTVEVTVDSFNAIMNKK